MSNREILSYGTGDRMFDELVDWFKKGRPDPDDKPGEEGQKKKALIEREGKIVKEENQREYRQEREEWAKTGNKQGG